MCESTFMGPRDYHAPVYFDWQDTTAICKECVEIGSPAVQQCSAEGCERLCFTPRDEDAQEQMRRDLQGNRLCYRCFNDAYFFCPSCDQPTLQTEGMESPNGELWCPSCMDTLNPCAECDSDRLRSRVWEVEGRKLCRVHAAQQINTIIRQRRSRDVAEVEAALTMVCELDVNVMRSRMYTCTSCSNAYRDVPGGTLEVRCRYVRDLSANTGICPDCYRRAGNRVAGAYQIRNYSHRPIPDFRKVEINLDERALFFGTEVEIEMAKGQGVPRESALIQLGEQDGGNGLFYCKSDSSIRNGFELVSHPFTYEWMKKNEDAFKPMFNLAKLMKGYDAENCGMHVHMSNDAFTNFHLLKFMKFFKENEAFITRISRRPAKRLRQWANTNLGDNKELLSIARTKRGEQPHGRGSAINTSNSNTVECRIFRSTLAPTVYFGNVEFLQALFDFTKTCGYNHTTYERFIDFVHERGAAYKNFICLNQTTEVLTFEREE